MRRRALRRCPSPRPCERSGAERAGCVFGRTDGTARGTAPRASAGRNPGDLDGCAARVASGRRSLRPIPNRGVRRWRPDPVRSAIQVKE